MGTLTTDDGVALHVDVHEPHAWSGTTVVLTHGFAQASGCWHHQVTALVAAGHRVVTWDLRGHGRSERGGTEPGIGRLADDLALVVEHTAPHGDVVLAGHSMGGMTVMALGELHPDLLAARVRAAAFVSTSATADGLAWLGLRPAAVPLVQRLAGAVFGLLSRRQRAWLLVQLAGPAAGAVIWLLCCGWRTSLADGRLTVDLARPGGFTAMADWLPALLANERTLDAFQGMPVLVLNGSADLLVPDRDSEAIAEALPGSRRVRVPWAGHNVMLAAPGVVNDELVALVARATSSTRD